LMEQEIDVTDRIISNLTEMAHGKQPQKQRIDLEALLGEVFDRLEHRDRVQLQMDVEPRPFVVAADPVQLRQVLGNLMANAAQAMPAEGHIRLRARRDGDTDTIVLADDGPGIPSELREHIFEPLFTTKPKGTGLGLTICRQIIQRHGGAIELIETGSQGAAFQVRLPTAVAIAANSATR
jgi:two-component system, NtrC family, sensor histidine kinase HydH